MKDVGGVIIPMISLRPFSFQLYPTDRIVITVFIDSCWCFTVGSVVFNVVIVVFISTVFINISNTIFLFGFLVTLVTR